MPRLLPFTLLLLLLLTGVARSEAQTIPLRHFTVTDGLPSNLIYSIDPQTNGYLWIATDKGIARYNGQGFKAYTTADGLPDNEIFNVREDYEGRLWLSAFNGTLCYYKDNVFHTPANTPWLKLPFRSNQISSTLDADSSLFIYFTDRSTLLHIRGERIKVITLKDRSLQYLLYCNTLPGGHYRVWYQNYDIEIDSLGNTLKTHFRHEASRITVLGSFLRGAPWYLFANDTLYTLKDLKAVYHFKRTRLNLGNGSLSALISGKDVMACTPGGLNINDSLQIPTTLPVHAIDQDRDGNFWFGTKGKGVYQFSKHFKEMAAYSQVYEGQATYAKILGQVLFFTNNAGDLYRFNDNKVTRIVKVKERDFNLTRAHLYIDDEGNYFMVRGSNSGFVPGLYGPQRNLRMFQGFLYPTKSQVASKGYLYSFSVLNIDKYSIAQFSKNFPPQRHPVDSIAIVKAGRIYTQAQDPSDHTLWFACANTVYIIKDSVIERQPQMGRYTFRQMALSAPYFTGVTETNELIIACGYKGSQPVFDTISGANCVWEYLYPIDRQHILITTNNYHRLLTLLPPGPGNKPRYTLHTIEDPFIPLQVEALAADSNNCYFFKDGNILRVATRVLLEQTPAPTPVFSSFKTTSRIYPLSAEIAIPYSQSNNINIVFDNISFGSKEISCEYAISKQDSGQWIPISGNAINLSTPGFGAYTLQIRAKTLSGNYGSYATLRFTVLRPFWATWWFITLCVLTFIALTWAIIYLVSRMRIRKKQRQHEADMKYQQSEYKALNALMNPHFIFNSLNNIQGLINKDEKRVANEYLVIFSDLVRQNMHNISQGFISLQQELNLVENYLMLEKLRFRELVSYELHIDEEIDTEAIMIPPLMIQPLVENAIKHGLLPRQSTDSKVVISVQEQGDHLLISITDNGIGITKSLQSKNRLYESFGLANLNKRTEHLKKIQQREIDIRVAEIIQEDGTVSGTEAVIRIASGEV